MHQLKTEATTRKEMFTKMKKDRTLEEEKAQQLALQKLSDEANSIGFNLLVFAESAGPFYLYKDKEMDLSTAIGILRLAEDTLISKSKNEKNEPA